MRGSKLIQTVVMIALVVMLGGVAGCGGESKSSCDCGLCVNDVPVYPCDSAESCAQFATDQGCGTSHLISSTTDTCGGDPQPVCQVRDCEGQCACPNIEQ